MPAGDPREKEYPRASEVPLAVEKTIAVTDAEYAALKERAKTAQADKASQGFRLLAALMAIIREGF